MLLMSGAHRAAGPGMLLDHAMLSRVAHHRRQVECNGALPAAMKLWPRINAFWPTPNA
jgi:hypothetical protein